MVLSHLFDRTNGVNPSTTPGYSIRLNGSDNERNGIARSLSVMPGDKIDMQVFGKYYDPNTPQTNQTAWDNLVGLITQVADAAQTVVVDGVGYTSGSLRIPPTTGVLTDPNESAAYPKAHLNWATFDRDWKFLDGGAKQLQGGAEDGTDVPFAEISKSIEIKEPGYVYIWLSNTSAQQRDVFFDDFKVVHTKSPVVQQDEYYPFGLTFNSYQRENSILNKWRFQGQEHVDDLGLNWDSFKWRNHQPDLGRFFNVDPLSEKYVYNSVYAFSENKVVAHVELEGLESWSIKNIDNTKGIIGGAFVSQEAAQKYADEHPTVNGFIRSGSIQKNHVESLERGNFKDDPIGVVLHRTDGFTASSAIGAFKSRGYGTHFIVDKDGTVTQTASLEKWTAHVGTPKDKDQTLKSPNSVGIEVVGKYDMDTEKWEPLTTDQINSVSDLINTLIKMYDMKVDAVANHEDLSAKTPGEGKVVQDAVKDKIKNE